jgi:hypothetical protein
MAKASPMMPSALKRYEDALNPFVSGWVSIEYLERRCAALGSAVGSVDTVTCTLFGFRPSC